MTVAPASDSPKQTGSMPSSQEAGNQQGAGKTAWEHALMQCFHKLDLDKSGYIELKELRQLAKQITPQANLADALDMMKFVDLDDDHRISQQEFLRVMLPMAESMSESQFMQHVSAMLGAQPHEAFNQPGYTHAAGSRAWLQEQQVVSVLREGLLALCDQLATQRVQLSAGTQWQSGPQEGEGGEAGSMYLPHGWRPFNALRWLGQWLLQKLPPSEADLAAGNVPLPSFSQLSRHAKIELAFKHLDRDGSGFLDSSELLSIAGKLHKDQDMKYAQELLNSMDLDQNGRVELHEYNQFVQSLTEVLTDEEFDAAMHKVLGASHFSYCTTREDKLAFVFRELDQGNSGLLPYEDMVQLAHRLEPTATPWKIQATFENANIKCDNVTVEQFVAGLMKLLSHLSDADVEQTIVTLVEGRKLGASVHPTDPLDEVEPLKYRTLLQSMHLPEHVMEFGAMEVIDIVDGGNVGSQLLLIDVRSEGEVGVSCLPGALHVPVHQDPGSALGWALGDLEGLRRQLATRLTEGSRLPRIVAYCNTGERSAPASVLLSRILGLAVRSLCGGIINYYNQGGRVRDPTGAEVQAIHPGSSSLKVYVTRPSSYKLP